MTRHFDPGDRVTATCGVCQTSISIPLEGVFSNERYEAAVDKCTDWIEAHGRTFHPEAFGAKAAGNQAERSEARNPNPSPPPSLGGHR